ncbi:hypothetical protein CLOP_g8682 [Closterium sp. NIES-67]|nr:hypothetical protein CLOP_g8682 [Closterium sp. NIES-67]
MDRTRGGGGEGGGEGGGGGRGGGAGEGGEGGEEVAAVVDLVGGGQGRLVPAVAFRRYTRLLNPPAAEMLGSRFRLARDMLVQSEAARERQLQDIVGDGAAGKVSLTTDIWSSPAQDAFLAVTAHWITTDFQLRQALLECLAHILNLAVQKALGVPAVLEPLKRMREIASFIGWSTTRSDAFEDEQLRLAGQGGHH